jgi:hypothetical protein
MTQLIKNAIISSILSFAFISGTIGEKCDRLEMYDLYITRDNIEADLISGVWETNLIAPGSKLFFQEDGIVQIVSPGYPENGISIETWNVQKMDSHFVLTISSETGNITTAKLYPTCEGFSIRSTNTTSMAMTKLKLDTRKLVQSARSEMQGVWDIIAETMPENPRSLKWSFKGDGTFALYMSPDLFHTIYQGIWDIAPDGEHIILYFTRSENSDEVYSKEIVKINNLDYEDLVLSGEALAKLTGQADGMTKVYFEKEFQ